MIVGNGDIPEQAADYIDDADLVIRFNDCRSMGNGGRRTDVIAVCNTGRPALAMLAGGFWTSSGAVKEAGEIWCVRDPGKFADLRGPLALSHPELDDFCDDYTDGFQAFGRATGKAVRVIGRDIHEALDLELQALDAALYVSPSTGMVAIAETVERVAGPDDAVFLAGFGHAGWNGHPFHAERLLVDRFVREGRVSRLEIPSISAFSQGA